MEPTETHVNRADVARNGSAVSVACPTCKATVGLFCRADDGITYRKPSECHDERVDLCVALLSPTKAVEGAPATLTDQDLADLATKQAATKERLLESRNEKERAAPCPLCGARAGAPCLDLQGTAMDTQHPERHAPGARSKAPDPVLSEAPAGDEATARILEMGRRAEAIAKRNPILAGLEPPAPEEESPKDPFARILPTRYLSARFDSLELSARVKRKAAISEARLAASKPAVLFLGSSGAGKSTLAAATLRYRAELDKRVTNKLFVDALDLAFARARHPLGEGEAPEVQAAMTVGLLVLDDMGSEAASALSCIAEVLAARYRNFLPTWVTTWMTPKDAVDRYGEGIARRVFQGADPIDCGGADWVRGP